MNESSHRVGAHDPEQPEHHENDKDGPEHLRPPFINDVARDRAARLIAGKAGHTLGKVATALPKEVCEQQS